MPHRHMQSAPAAATRAGGNVGTLRGRARSDRGVDLVTPDGRPTREISSTGTCAHTIVLIDDLDEPRMLTRLLLSARGYHVVEAADGIAGLAAIRRERPHLAFVDLGLPGIDGFEVARRVRAVDALRGVYLVALTGYGTADFVRRSKEAGFDRHVTKPLDLAILDAILGHRARA